MEIRDILLIIFTATIAFATIYYAIVTQRLWRATMRNAELLRKSFQYTLLYHYRERLGEMAIGIIMQAVFADEFGEMLERIKTKGVTDKDIIKELREGIIDVEIKELVVGGKIEKAITLAEYRYSDDPSKGLQLINVLLESKEEENWNRAWEVLRKVKEGSATVYLSLSYSFWSINRIKDAIDVGEKGLEIIKKREDEFNISKLKNNLAYYYADLGDLRYEEVARRYAREALIDLPDNHDRIDTQGYVKIVYGKTAKEIKEGVYLCEKALSKGGPLELYVKHIGKAIQKLPPYSK